METTATLTCPFPAMLRFTDPDPESKLLHQPLRGGRWWAATDGKILAFQDAGDVVGPSNPDIRRHCDAVAAMNLIWLPLPTKMPVAPGKMRTCTCCHGSGRIGVVEDCDACEGTGECPHCGHECEECDGDGSIDTDRPGEPCASCGGSGSIQEGPQWLLVYGHPVTWRYAALLVGVGAEVAWGDLLGSKALIFRTHEGLRGFVMPLKLSSDQATGLVSIPENT